jgi:hypothetical protein
MALSIAQNIRRGLRQNPQGAKDVRYVRKQVLTLLAIVVQTTPYNPDFVEMLTTIVENLETVALRLFQTPNWLH